jgi:hypothetical protein
MNITKESFKTLPELKTLEDLANFKLRKNFVALAFPEVSKYTEGGIAKSDKLIETEQKEIFKNALIVVGKGETDENIELGNSAYLRLNYNVSEVKFLKNKLGETFIVFIVGINEILMYA